MAGPQDSLKRATSGPGDDPGRTPTIRRIAGWALTLGSAGVILGLTLVPSHVPGAESPSIHCVICGRFGLANLIRNVVLFVPLGMGLGLVTRRFAPAWMPAVAMTALIEFTQFFIPGRNPLLIDFVTNATGAAIGILFIRSLFPIGRSGQRPPGLAAPAWWAVSAAALTGSAFAFQLAPPSPPHFIQIQADLGHFDRYAGTVESVRLLGEPLTIGRFPDADLLEERIFGGAPVEVDFARGPDPGRIAPLLSIYTWNQEELFVLGVTGKDVVLRIPYRALQWRLDRPDHRVRGVLDAVGTGEPVRVSYRMTTSGGRAHRSACVRVEGPNANDAASEHAEAGGRILADECGMAPTMGQGWTLLLYPSSAPEPVQSGLDWAWLFALGLVPGLFARSLGGAAVMGVGLVLVAAGTPWLFGSMATFGIGQALGLAAGTGVGWWVMRSPVNSRGGVPPAP